MKTPGASWKASRASAVGSSWALKTGEALSTGMPATCGLVEDRRGVGERFGARLEGGEEALGGFEEGVDRRQVFDRGVEGLRALGDRFLDVGARDPGEGGEGPVEGDEEGAVDLARPGRSSR